jgi:cytoskeletal protein CcmA (bactofilin family)
MFGLILLFRSSDPDPLPALSIIGDDTTIRGDTITGSGDLRIEGTIHADIVREGRVVVAPDGAVHGTVQAESIEVAGTVRGELVAETTLVLGASSDVEARLQADALTIESGADFKGVVHDEDGSFVPSLEKTSGDHRPPIVSMTPPPSAETRADDAAPVSAEASPDDAPAPAANRAFVSVWDKDDPGAASEE